MLRLLRIPLLYLSLSLLFLSACGVNPFGPAAVARITAPVDGAAYASGTSIAIIGSVGGAGVRNVQVMVDGVAVAKIPVEEIFTPVALTWLLNGVGTHVVHLEALDVDGVVLLRSDLVTVRVLPVPPTVSPTALPTVSPTALPTASPTALPTVSPTARPTVSPTARPTVSPTARPTVSATREVISVPAMTSCDENSSLWAAKSTGDAADAFCIVVPFAFVGSVDGDVITMRWTVSGVEKAEIYVKPEGSQCSPGASAWHGSVPPAINSFTIERHKFMRGGYRIHMRLTLPGGVVREYGALDFCGTA